MSDLEQALGETPVPETPVEQPEEPKVEEPQVEQPEEPKEPEFKSQRDTPMVPVSVVQELRQEIRSLKQANEKPVEVPDVLEDQQGYTNHLTQAVQSAVTQTKLEMSKFMAVRDHGEEVVNAAYAYFDQHPEQSAALLGSPSPFHAAVDEFNKVRIAQEIGSDPAAYRAKLEQEIRATVEAEMVAKAAQEKAKPAPSMANVTGTGGGPTTTWSGPTSLGSILPE